MICSYANALDNRQWETFISLFTEDAVWQRPSLEPIVGHAAIRQWTEQWPGSYLSRHIASNIVVDVESADRAAARSCATVYRCDKHAGGVALLEGPTAIVDYRDQLQRTRAGWRFAHREYQFIFRAK